MKQMNRRGFFKRLLSFSLFASLFAAYGTFGSIALRFLHPISGKRRGWIYLAQVKKIKVGESLPYKSPNGASIEVVRSGNTGKADDFFALSNVCPHLGCRVRWEAQNERFFCPCHNGVFDTTGKAIAGPPAKAKQSLKKFPLKVKKGLLYIEVKLENTV